MTDQTPSDLSQALANPKPVKAKGDKKPPKPKAVDQDSPRWIQTDAPTLPDDCPVVPLGRDRRRYAFIDSNRQFVEVDVQQLGSDGVADLFAHPKAFAWMWKNFPRFNKEGVQNGFDKERLKLALMQACAFKGPFDFDSRVRNVGAWRDDEGRLHWHLGDSILVVSTDGLPAFEQGPLVHDYVYPHGPKQPRPSDKRDPKLLLELFELLKKWNWNGGELEARLMLGWICCALLGGSLDWRTHIWVRGPTGAGKSTLQMLIKYLSGGDRSLVQASDASGAGIWTAVGNRSIPVALDEMEARAGDTRHTDNVINLAKLASSGAKILRGGANHTSHEFTVYCAFMFSSINVPALEPEHMSRIGQVRLLPAPKGASELAFGMEPILETGRQIRRILVDAWPTWTRQLASWRDGLIRLHEFSPRIADTWGALLAMADLMLNVEERLADTPPEDELVKWTGLVAPSIKRMLSESGAEWERLIKHLRQHKLDPYQRGQRWTIETLIAIAAKRPLPEDVKAMVPAEMNHERANSGLIVEGLKVVMAQNPATKTTAPTLAVQKRHTGLDGIFFHTRWKNGVYAQQFENVPGMWTARQRFAAGDREPAFMVPLEAILGDAQTPLEAAIADRREDELEIRDEPELGGFDIAGERPAEEPGEPA